MNDTGQNRKIGSVTVWILVGKEPGNERSVQRGSLHGVEQIRRDRDAGDHVLEDEGLVF